MTQAVEFCFLVEEGRLERQAVALAASIRLFSGRHSGAAITVVSPRRARRPSPETRRALDKLGADYVELDVASPAPEYGPSHRVYALAEIARRTGPPLLAQVDSDTLFCADPDFEFDGSIAAARAVDMKGMCSEGPGDPAEGLWLQLATVAGVSLDDLPYVETTVCRTRVRASHNGGLVIGRRDSGIFQTTERIFSGILAAGLRPFAGRGLSIAAGAGVVEGVGAEWWGTTQAALSLAAAKLGGSLRLLGDGHNIPVHLDLAAREKPRHLHYHLMLDAPETARRTLASPLLQGCSREFRDWLETRLPL